LANYHRPSHSRNRPIAVHTGILRYVADVSLCEYESEGRRFESARWLSLLPINKRNTRNEVTPGDLPGASLHHRYITEAWVNLTHKLLPRNGRRNV
jgi:hypothetical protein